MYECESFYEELEYNICNDCRNGVYDYEKKRFKYCKIHCKPDVEGGFCANKTEIS